MTPDDFRLLEKLIACPSVEKKDDSHNSTNAIAECLRMLSDAFGNSLNARPLEAAGKPLILFSSTGGMEFDLVLAGHVDVVPAPPDLFRLTASDDRLSGRGTFDMKGPLLASLCAVRDFLATHATTKKRIAFLVSADEETSGDSVKTFLATSGIKAAFALVPDGGEEEYAIVVEEKGFLQFRVTVHSKSAHASRPWDGVNPIDTICEIRNHFNEHFPPPKSKTNWKTSVVLTKFVTNTEALNQTPACAQAWFDARYVKGWHRDRILDEVRQLIGETSTCDVVSENQIHRVDPQNEHVLKLRCAIERATGKQAPATSAAGTSDAVFFEERGIPAVLIRPEGGGLHGPDEWVSKKSLEGLYKIVLAFLEDF